MDPVVNSLTWLGSTCIHSFLNNSSVKQLQPAWFTQVLAPNLHLQTVYNVDELGSASLMVERHLLATNEIDTSCYYVKDIVVPRQCQTYSC